MFYSETIYMLFLLLKKKRLRFVIYLCFIGIVIFYCPPKEVFLYRNSNWDPDKVSVVRRCPRENCPLHRGFLIRILYETNPFLKSVRWKEVSTIEDVHYREVSLYLNCHICSEIYEVIKVIP